MSRTDEAKVTLEIGTSVDEDPLVLASFPEGAVRDGLSFSLSQSGWKTQLTAETKELRLLGTNFGKSNHKLDSSQWLVGVHDPETDSMTLHPVSHVFPLRSTVKAYQSAAVEESVASSAKERRALLFEDFGASKKKRALAASAANLVSSEQALGADDLTAWMGEGAGGGGSDDDEHAKKKNTTDAAIAEGRRHVLPAFNTKTSNVSKCFDVKGIIAAAPRAALKRHLSSLKGEWPSHWPLTATKRCPLDSGSDTAIDCALLRHLITLHVKQPKHFKTTALLDEAKALEMPAELLRALLEKFTVAQEEGRHFMTKALSDKLALHLLVVALSVNNWRLPVDAQLSDDLQMAPAAITGLLRQVGCKILSSGTPVAVLEAPLVFPERKRKKG